MQRSILLLFLLLFSYCSVSASNGSWSDDVLLSAENGWYEFRPGNALNPTTLFIDHKESFDLGANDEMRLRRTEKDELNFTHYRFQQYHKGVRVEFAEMIVHVNAQDEVYMANGKLAKGLNQPAQASLSASDVIDVAMQIENAELYSWELPHLEAALQMRKRDPEATHYPKPELVFSKGSGGTDWRAGNFRLAWKLAIHAASPHSSNEYVIDAISGELLNKIPLEHQCDATNVNTIWDGNQNFNTDQMANNNFRLFDDCQNATILIQDWNSPNATPALIDIISADNTWNNNPNQQFGASVLWATAQSQAFFQNVFNRNGYDGSNANIGGAINAMFNTPGGGFNANNASFNATTGFMRVGLGGGALNNSWGPLDIIAHELTHGVTGTSSNLVYQGESGALNESFSDIFGEVIEASVTGSADWYVGAQRTNGAIRSMLDPDSLNHPDTYLGANWFVIPGCASSGATDFCGVHTNSGVQNYWFYLITVGDTGTNDNGFFYDITGMGLTNARSIAYRALTVYLTANDQYIDAREASLRAALDLFGSCSDEAITVGKAWEAVGVGSLHASYDLAVCGNVQTAGSAMLFQGINSIEAADNCVNDVSASNANVRYLAGQTITFNPGFSATVAAENAFSAILAECSYSLWKEESLAQEFVQLNEAFDDILNERAFDFDVFPNPFSDGTTVRFNLNASQQVDLKIFDLHANLLIQPLNAQYLDSGQHDVEIDLGSMTAGVYFVHLTQSNERSVRRIVKL